MRNILEKKNIVGFLCSPERKLCEEKSALYIANNSMTTFALSARIGS